MAGSRMFDAGSGAAGFSPYQQAVAGAGIGGILGGIFNDSGAPYDAAMEQYKKWAKKGEEVQNPFYKAGLQGTDDFQKWLQGQADPSAFINHLMTNYQASPYSNYLQQQSIRAAQNAGSASGLTGSTPLMQQIQQNAGNIASGDMNQWLQHVLGINTQYGQGQQSLMQGGQNAANALTNLYGNLGNNMAQAAYGREAGNQQDSSNILGGIASLGMMFL